MKKKLNTAAFKASDLVSVCSAGLHKCPSCYAELTTTVPSTRAPKCGLCDCFMAPVNDDKTKWGN